ncbi:hypothetical protein ON010_g5903 [Phytophthora cinnamomi]|nr:hypothetical protein ON010_g5903 [Phytophthora cinnamomi]
MTRAQSAVTVGSVPVAPAVAEDEQTLNANGNTNALSSSPAQAFPKTPVQQLEAGYARVMRVSVEELDLEPHVYIREGSELMARLRDQLTMLPGIQDLSLECKIEEADVGEPDATTPEMEAQLKKILKYHRWIFLGDGNAAPAPARGGVCDLDVGNVRPVAQRARQIAPHLLVKVYELLKKLQETGLVEHSESEWASPIVIVLKKNGVDTRMCIYYRVVNAFIKLSRMPFGLKNAPLVYQAVINSCLWGFVRLPPEEEALVDRDVLEFLRLDIRRLDRSDGQGLRDSDVQDQSHGDEMERSAAVSALTDEMTVFKHNIPAPPQMGPELGRSSYIDDIAHGAPTWDQLREDLNALLFRLRYWNISVRLPKSEFGKLTIPPAVPFHAQRSSGFPGSLNYQNKFIEDLPVVSASLYNMTEDQVRAGRDIERTKEPLTILKRKVVSTPMLRHPDRGRQFLIIPHANPWAACAVLGQMYDGVIQHVRFTGHILNEFELRYHIAEKEFLAILRLEVGTGVVKVVAGDSSGSTRRRWPRYHNGSGYYSPRAPRRSRRELIPAKRRVKKRRATAEEQEQQQEQQQEQEQPTLEEQQPGRRPRGRASSSWRSRRATSCWRARTPAAEAQTLRELLQLKAQHLQQQQHAAEDADVAWGREPGSCCESTEAPLSGGRRAADAGAAGGVESALGRGQERAAVRAGPGARAQGRDGRALRRRGPRAAEPRVLREAVPPGPGQARAGHGARGGQGRAVPAAAAGHQHGGEERAGCQRGGLVRDQVRHPDGPRAAAHVRAGDARLVLRRDGRLPQLQSGGVQGSHAPQLPAHAAGPRGNATLVGGTQRGVRRAGQGEAERHRPTGRAEGVGDPQDPQAWARQVGNPRAHAADEEATATAEEGAKRGERHLGCRRRASTIEVRINTADAVVMTTTLGLWPSIRSRPRASLSLSKCSPVPAPVMARRPSHQRIRRDSLQLQRDGSGGASFYGYVNELRNAFDPHSGLLKSWHQILFGCLLYEAFLLPFASTFAVKFALPTSTVAFRAFYAAEVLFLADFYVKLNTGFYEAGNIHRDTRKVRAKYLKSFGFLLDVVAIIPLSIILPTPMVPVPSTTSETACWPGWYEFHKVLRVWRLPGYFSNLDDVYAKYFRALKLFKVLVATAFVAHFIACCRFAMGWKSGVADASNPWLPSAALGSKPLATQYVGALFWSVGLLTGSFEGALPRGNTEFAFTLAAVLLGFMLFIYSSATLFMLSKSESNQTVLAQARINQLRHLLTFHHVPESLQVQAVEYLKRHYTDAESNDREVVKLLCPSITKDIQVELLKDMVGRIPLFRDCNQQFIVALTSLLEMTSFPAHVTLFEAGDRGDYMYVVNSGVLHILVNGVKVRELRVGAFFGEISVFSKRPRSAAVVTTSYCTLYRLSRFHIERVLEGYPHYAAQIAAAIDEMVNERDARAAQGQEAEEFMLTTLYQLSTSSPVKIQRRSLRDRAKRAVSLRRSKSTRVVSASRHAEYDGGTISVSEKRAINFQPTPILLPPKVAPKKSPTGKMIRSQSAYARRLSSGVNLWPHRALSVKSTNGNHGDSMQGFYDNLARRRATQFQAGDILSKLLSRLLMQRVIDHTAMWRMYWLIALQVHLAANWFVAPLLLAFPVLDRPSTQASVNTTFAMLDILLTLPTTIPPNGTSQRCTDIDNTPGVAATSTAATGLAYSRPLEGMGKRLSAQQHLVVGFGNTSDNEHPWLPSSELELRRYVDPNGVPYYTGGSTNVSLTDAEVRNIASMQYMRSLYFGATMLTTLGKTVEPSSALQYSATLVLMLCGFFSLALMIDSVQKRLTASAFEQKEFLVTRTRVQQFINSQTAPTAVHQRAKSFLEFWWSCHRGAIASELLSELPEAIKRPVVRSMCQPALRTLSLLADVRPCLDALEQVFIDNIRFILYGQGEIIYRQGDYASGLFFLLEGELIVIVNGGMPRTLVKGGFIGTAALNLSETSVSYAERVTAASGCILIFISRENLNGMHKVFPSFSMALRALEKRLEGAKLPRAQHDYNSTRERSSSGALRPMPVSKPLTYEMKVLRYLDLDDVIFDPDENIAAVWELWTFCLIIALYLKVVEDITTGVESSHVINSEVVAVIIEIFFALDFYFQSRLGYYEYGNKIMDLVAIRKRFFRSHRCYCAALALFPLYVVNWMLGSAHRYELFSVNKLLRLFRAPIIFAKLESKYLNRTVQLRLAKLVIVSLVMSHLFGCIWLNFKDPGFQNAWMPSPSLTKADPGTQYSALLFWSFGIMSHSNSGELPKSVEQCFFTVVVLLGGAFLFAFVIGNISDVVELVDADSREFNAKLSCLRLLLGHFHLPLAIEEQLKTYFFFQRYHTITQEYLLERCLPPSLLTEIRLVHLQPMIVKVGFLAGMEGSVTRMLVAQFVQALTVKDQYVFRLGEEGSDMFFVFTGIVEVLVPLETLQRRQSNDMKLFSLGSPSRSSFRTVFPTLDPSKLQAKGQLKKVNELTSGSYFGEVSLFTSKPRSAHARSKTSCVLYKLSRRSLELVFERYPDWKRKVLKIVNIQQEQQLLRNLYMEEQLDIAANTTKNMLNHVDVLGDSANIGQANNDRNRSMRSSVGSFSERTTSGPLRQRNTSTRPVGITALKSAGSFFSSYKAQRSASTNMAVLQISSRKKSVLWVDMLLQCTDAQSAFHIQWLKIIAASTIYMALAIPYRNSFDALERLGPFPIAARVIELTCEVLFGWDIWVHWNLKDGLESMELYESKQRDAYQKERLWIDIVAAIPIDHFLSDFYQSPLLCMNRCLKLFNFPHYMKEINRRSVAYEKYRFWTLWVLFFVLLHWCACAYFSLASATVSSDTAGSESCWDNWSPPRSALSISWTDPSLDLLMLRFLRGLFFASTAFIKKGKVFEPSDHTDYLFTLFVDFVGLVTMAFMIGEMANLYISYISNEVEFRKNHIAVELYLERWHITGKLRARCHAFLSSLWSSHRGVNYQAIFDEIPLVIRTESILHIANLPLRAFINSVFRPFATAHPHDRDVEALTRSIAQHLKYEGYPRDECVLVEGRVSNEMYFVVKGHLIATTSADRPEHSIRSDQHYKKGDFFGEHGLLGYSVGVCTVKTVCACDLLSLSSESLLEVILSRPIFQAALSIAVEGYRELYKRTRLMDATSTKEDTASAENDWGVELFRILDARRKLWLDEALAFKAADSDSDGPVNEPWTVSCFKPGQEMGLVTISTPSSCMKVFEKLIRLIATRGTLDMKHLQSATQFQETLPIMAADLNTHRSNLSMTEKSDSSKRSSHRKPYI